MTEHKAKISRQDLIYVTDYLKRRWQIEGKDGWRLHDLLMKLARSYDESSGSAKIYLTLRDMHTLTETSEILNRFKTVWTLPDDIGQHRHVRLTLKDSFTAHFADYLATAKRFIAQKNR